MSYTKTDRARDVAALRAEGWRVRREPAPQPTTWTRSHPIFRFRPHLPDGKPATVTFRYADAAWGWIIDEAFMLGLAAALAPAPAFRCVYCGNEVAVRDLQNGSDGACCGEVGHVERADER